MTELTGLTLGHYRLLEPLVEGRMTLVYKAYDSQLDSVVAVKIIRTKNVVPSALQKALESFLHEAELLLHLSHPNIVSVTDYGQYQGMPYLVMPDLPTRTLEQWLGRPIPWQEAVRLIAPIAHALAYAHQQGVVHRDLQPFNILVADKGQPMLADFGVSRLFDSIGAGDLLGPGKDTLVYMAPEQWRGSTNEQTNIYSLGVILYEMITGRKPYSVQTAEALRAKQASGRAPRAKSLLLALPDAVDEVLSTALASDPADRYLGMGAMAAELDALTVARPGEAPVAPEESSRWEQRESAVRTEPSWLGSAVPAVSTGRRSPRSPFLYAGLAAAGLIVVAGLAVAMLGGRLTKGPAALAPTAQVAAATHAPEPTALSTAAVDAAPAAPEEIVDAKGAVMRLVAGGDFVMGGSEDLGAAECTTLSGTDANQYPAGTCADAFKDQAAAHTVNVEPFYMDRYEVANAAYADCLRDGACAPPMSRDSTLHPGYFEDARYAAYPVIYVDWNMASAYCAWRGARLPTEAEWEKAARGPDGLKYPWGDSLGQMKVNFCDSQCPEPWRTGDFYDGYPETAPVDGFAGGSSVYGILNLGGNVWEWVSDGIQVGSEIQTPALTPAAGAPVERRIARGGSWQDPAWATTTFYRVSFPITQSSPALGFRCARSK